MRRNNIKMHSETIRFASVIELGVCAEIILKCTVKHKKFASVIELEVCAEIILKCTVKHKKFASVIELGVCAEIILKRKYIKNCVCVKVCDGLRIKGTVQCCALLGRVTNVRVPSNSINIPNLPKCELGSV